MVIFAASTLSTLAHVAASSGAPYSLLRLCCVTPSSEVMRFELARHHAAFAVPLASDWAMPSASTFGALHPAGNSIENVFAPSVKPASAGDAMASARAQDTE